MYPLAGAITGAGVGAIGGPATAALGAGAGYAIGETLKEGVYGDDDPEAIAGAVAEVLTAKDVDSLIETRTQGLTSKVLKEVTGLLKLAGIGILLYLLVPILYTWHRKRKAQPFYDLLEDLRRKVDDQSED